MATQDADALLLSIVELGRLVLGAQACSLAVLDADEEHLVFRAACGAGAEDVTGLRLPVRRGIAGWVVSSGQPVAVADVARDPRFAADVAAATGAGTLTVTAVPTTLAATSASPRASMMRAKFGGAPGPVALTMRYWRMIRGA
jgi:GAF domain-containing protein